MWICDKWSQAEKLSSAPLPLSKFLDPPLLIIRLLLPPSALTTLLAVSGIRNERLVLTTCRLTDLSEKQTVGDVLSEHEATDEVMRWSSFATVWTKHERIQASLSTAAAKRKPLTQCRLQTTERHYCWTPVGTDVVLKCSVDWTAARWYIRSLIIMHRALLQASLKRLCKRVSARKEL